MTPLNKNNMTPLNKNHMTPLNSISGTNLVTMTNILFSDFLLFPGKTIS